MLDGPPRFASFRFVLLPVATTGLLAFALYVVLLSVPGWLLVRLQGFSPIPVAAACACFAIVFMILVILAGLSSPAGPRVEAFRLIVFASLGVGAAVLVYFIWEEADSFARLIDVGFRFSLWVPFLLAQTALFVWLLVYQIDGLLTGWGLAALVAYLSGSGMSLALALRAPGWTGFTRALAVLALALLCGSGVTLVRPRAFAPSGASPDRNPAPRVILLTVDTLRADAVLPDDGSSPPLAPNMRRLARDGVVFRHAFSAAPWTLPAFASIMTGLSPATHMRVSGHREHRFRSNVNSHFARS